MKAATSSKIFPQAITAVLVGTVGYKADVKAGGELEADENAAYDFALEKAADPLERHFDLLSGAVLLPDARGKKTLFDNCMSCHGLQSKMAATRSRRGRLARPRELHARSDGAPRSPTARASATSR